MTARLKAWCEGDDFTLLAETINVSRDGLFVRTSSPAPLSDRFRLTIEELDAVANVEVCWTRTSRDQGRRGMGLRIVGFERGGRAFEHYVDQARSPSGEFKVSWPPVKDKDDEDPEAD